MEAVGLLASGQAAAFRPTAPVVRLGRAIVASGLALLALAGLVLCARRLQGALVEPLGPATLVAVAICLAVAALVFRRVCTTRAAAGPTHYAIWVAPSLVLVLWISALALPETGSFSLALFSGIVLLEEGWSWGRLRLPGLVSIATNAVESVVDAEPAALGSLSLVHGDDQLLEPDEELGGQHDASTSQQLVRRTEEGREMIEGWTRVDFAVGQRHAAAHLAICPPLVRTPVCYAEQADGPSAQVKVTQAMTYGVRCEVKLDEPAREPTSVIVEFSIQEPASAARSGA